MNTYEVIWAYSQDQYITRLFVGLSTVLPLFVGSLNECNEYIRNNTSA